MSKADQRIRARIRNSGRAPFHVPVCVKETAEIAVDTTYIGFEDPRAAAVNHFDENADRGQARCEVKSCEGTARISIMDDKCTFRGRCIVQNVCAVDVYNIGDLSERMKREDRLLDKIATQEQLSFLCPHVTCDFHFGFSVDGNSGLGGECMRGNIPARVEA